MKRSELSEGMTVEAAKVYGESTTCGMDAIRFALMRAYHWGWHEGFDEREAIANWVERARDRLEPLTFAMGWGLGAALMLVWK